MKTNLSRIQNNLETLSTFNSTPNKGLTRLSFTPEDREARSFIIGEMEKCGLHVYEDAVGNIIGRLEGYQKDAPAVMIGSHFDSVKNGGNFDGNAGVIAALEVAHIINEHNISFKYPIEFIALVEEEGGRFSSGLFGSRGIAGKISRKDLDIYKDINGISIADAMRDFGFNPDKISEAIKKTEELKAFLELHIEQGPILQNQKKDIGIVEYIVGCSQIEVTIQGRADHAGTTPMDMRVDALDSAAKIISKISDIAKSTIDGTVATVGNIKALPGAGNIIPDEVVFTVDIRSRHQQSIDSIISSITNELSKIANEKGISYVVQERLNIRPVKLDEKINILLSEGCNKLKLPYMKMVSGAGHDAMVMAELTHAALIFVPSKDGRSHCPEEWTDYEDLQKGVELLFITLLNLAEGDLNEESRIS